MHEFAIERAEALKDFVQFESGFKLNYKIDDEIYDIRVIPNN